MVKNVNEKKVPDELIPEENKGGNCYVSALEEYVYSGYKGVLVHGVVMGRGAIAGIRFGHAWVERDGKVIDKTMPKQMMELPIDVYYMLGEVAITRKYTGIEVARMVDKYGTYGPWDKIFDKYN